MFIPIVLFSLVLVGRLYMLQVLAGSEFTARAENQYVRPNYHHFNRGDIYMQDLTGGLVPLATTQSGYFVWVNPQTVEDPEFLWEEISQIRELDKDRFIRRLEEAADSDKNYLEIAHNLDRQEVIDWQRLESDQLTFHPQSWRYYPGRNLASHLTGFVGYTEDQQQGQYGLERYYENVLHKGDMDLRIDFFAQVFMNLGGSESGEESDHQEGDIITTINPDVQVQLERRLDSLHRETNGRLTAGIIMDPETGAVRAMAALPDYDLNNYSQTEEISLFSNPNVESVFEMGSVIKPITIAAGLDAGVINVDSQYYDEGRIEVDNFTIANFDGRGRGYIDMQDVLNHSVNTGVVHIMDQMGSQSFAEYMRGFGLDRKTEIDLPNEADNMIRSFDSPRRVEYATAAFGQGIALTPIGTARALSALANGGRVVRPYLVEAVRDEDGHYHNLDRPQKEHRAISQETSETITRMLVNTVDEALLHGEVKRERYSIAAKTGTAQIPQTDARGYRDDAFLHTFFGYFPAYDPELIIFLYVLEPQGYQYASQSLTHPFMDLTDFLINYYDIVPDR